MASAELGEHEAGVWAAACDALGRLLVTGTEDGSVVAMDARCRQTLWQVRCSFISLAWGVCRSPCGILMQTCAQHAGKDPFLRLAYIAKWLFAQTVAVQTSSSFAMTALCVVLC
jgi:hypothetical protein